MICDRWRQGDNRYGLPMATLFHTSHTGLAAALRRHPSWTQVSAALCGGNGARSQAQLQRAKGGSLAGHHGGHFRAVQGFRYLGAIRPPQD